MRGARRAPRRTSARLAPPPVLPPGCRWVLAKVAAAELQVHPRTVYRWCREAQVLCRRVTCHTGSAWRVALGPDGLPVWQ